MSYIQQPPMVSSERSPKGIWVLIFYFKIGFSNVILWDIYICQPWSFNLWKKLIYGTAHNKSNNLVYETLTKQEEVTLMGSALILVDGEVHM